jgi:hypothetical protein
MILRQTLRPVAIGVTIGMALAAVASQILTSILFGVSRFDPIAFIGAPLSLVGVATVATLLPARQAVRVDPVTILRSEVTHIGVVGIAITVPTFAAATGGRFRWREANAYESLRVLVRNPSLLDAESRVSLQVEREDKQSGSTSNYAPPPSAVNRRS